MTKGLRTRVAPSPSSERKSLHCGNIRTALYAYLVAKQTGGTFYVRLEDSDIARNVPGCAEGMIDDLKWLGIGPDEGYGTANQPYGPYTQLEHTKHYMQMAEYLIEKGLAYKCVCRQTDLDKEREEWNAKYPKQPWVYDGRCRKLNKDPDKDYVIRFKAPKEGETVHDDLVYGKIVYPHKENYDFIMMRANGNGLYNFLSVLGDIQHQTDVVIRGRDHSGPNTLHQILLYKAFGANLPRFGHLSMVNNMAGQKLAKRDGATDTKEMQAMGYSPEAVVSYIARLGWGHKNDELFSMSELVEKFDITRCGRSDVKLDYTKFAAINFAILKDTKYTNDELYAKHLLSFVRAKDLDVSSERLQSLIPLVRFRSRTLIEAANELDPILRPTIAIDPIASEKFLTPANKTHLQNLATNLKQVDNWSEETLRAATTNWLNANGLSLKDLQQPIRVASIGRTTGPELFQTLHVLGKDIAIERLSVA